MLYVGLTGNIASGKSEAAARFESHGATVVDADQLARDVVAVGSPGYASVVARWGTDVLAPDGTIDREALRHSVFADNDQLEELNRIIHPRVASLREATVAAARKRGDSVLIYVVPLLFERHLVTEFDRIILVDAPRELRLRRLVERRGVSPEDARNMIAAQMNAELKLAGSDYVIVNDGTIDDLNAQVDTVWSELTELEPGPSLAH